MNTLKSNYDLLVLGGGINGAAIARDAALRGLDVLLVESCDFACGASSKSSKLVHGGLRYLESFDLSLVKESLEERATLLATAPYHVRLLPFLLPVYKGQRYPLWMIRLGLKLYDFLAPRGHASHRLLNRAEILEQFPELNAQDLVGGCLYYDAEMRDNRLVFENIRSAEKAGADVLNYTCADIKKNRSQNLFHVDLISDIRHLKNQVTAKAVVKALGAWTMDPSAPLAPTKGVHLVLPLLHPTLAATLRAPQDERIFFILPWNGYTLLGTTETPFAGDPAQVSVDLEDVEYLLMAFKHYFPKVPLQQKDVIASFAGVRPLVKNFKGSRRHLLQVDSDGAITLVGGKFTTYRRMAEETVDLVVERLKTQKEGLLPCQTATIPLTTEQASIESLQALAQALNLEPEMFEHIISNYGPGAIKILASIQQNPEWSKRICPLHPHPLAELIFAIQEEHVYTPEDWFQRRTSIAYTPCNGEACYAIVRNYIRSIDRRHTLLSGYPESQTEPH